MQLQNLPQLTFVAFLLPHLVRSLCNVCQSNKVACINSTSYHLCYEDNKPDTEAVYHCKPGFDCTQYDAICVQSNNQRPPSCGDTSQCGLCSAQRNYLFACHSRGIYQFCYGAVHPIGQLGYCPKGYVCDASTEEICVPEVKGANVTCDVLDELVEPRTTAATTKRPTTPSKPLTALEVCETKDKTGLYPPIPADPDCRRYITCFFTDSELDAQEYSCAPGKYFDSKRQLCSCLRPRSCR